MEELKIGFIPKTKLGKWSVGSMLGFFLFFGLLNLFIALGERGGDTFFSNLLLAIPGLLAALSGIAAFVIGVVSIIKSKERAVLVFVAVILGSFILLFVAAELLFSH
jgi:hypothetical protein